MDSMMSDSDVEKEWQFIMKGNVEKLVQLMMQMQRSAGPEDAAELEEMGNLWQSLAEGIMKTKQAHREINQKEWDFMEEKLMQFADKFSKKLSNKPGSELPGSGRKQLSSMLEQVIAESAEPVLAKQLIAKRVRSAAQVDVDELAALEKEIKTLGRKMERLTKRLNNYVKVPTKIALISSDLLLFSYEVGEAKHEMEQAVREQLEEREKMGKEK
jgi:hypothetical protein